MLMIFIPRFGEKLLPVKLQGLDPMKMYKVEEINLMPGKKSRLEANVGLSQEII